MYRQKLPPTLPHPFVIIETGSLRQSAQCLAASGEAIGPHEAARQKHACLRQRLQAAQALSQCLCSATSPVRQALGERSDTDSRYYAILKEA